MHTNNDSIDVILSYAPLGLVRATSSDIHLDGMIVDTGSVSLARNAQVEVNLTLSGRESRRPQNCRISAQVVDSIEGGAYLLFDQYDDIILAGLKDLPQRH